MVERTQQLRCVYLTRLCARFQALHQEKFSHEALFLNKLKIKSIKSIVYQNDVKPLNFDFFWFFSDFSTANDWKFRAIKRV